MSAAIGFKQTNVSGLEKRADMKLSTLRDYVEALGGTLKIVADVAAGELICPVSRSARGTVQRSGQTLFAKCGS